MNYPVSHYHFRVEWGGTRIGFLEVSGLNIEIVPLENRDGASPEYSNTKMPGHLKYPDIILTRRIHKGDNEFFNWINTAALNKIERRDVSIALLDENHEPIIIWRLRNSFPIKYIGPVLKANESGMATESLVLTHEGMTVQNG